MILALLTSLTLGMASRADTVIMLDSREMEMTGEGMPESIQLVAAGPSKNKLTITFTILSGTEVLYADEVPASGDVAKLGREFFLKMKFETPQEFIAGAPGRTQEVTRMIARARKAPSDTAGAERVWQEIRGRRGALVFTFPIGPKGSTVIAWSQAGHRFYRLLE